MSAEFDTVAEWTAEVAVDLGERYYIPAGCRGSGSPAALRWFLKELSVSAADRMLDCGAGVGGPAAFAATQTGVRAVLLDPEPGACRAARRLFGLPTVRADAARLPFASGAFDVAWCLGVLCTMDDQAGLLAELRRVLTPTGRLGLLVFTASTIDHPDRPDGNNFPTLDRLRRLLRDAALRIATMAPAAGFGAEPAAWREGVDAVHTELDRRHHDDEAWRVAEDQSSTMARLLASGRVRGELLVLRPAT